MNPLFIIIPVVIAVIVVVYGIFRMVGRVWLERSIRLALLERIEEKPELVDKVPDILEALTGLPDKAPLPTKQDFTLTGVILAGIGLVCALIGRSMKEGTFAVGLYTGGMICVGLGVLLAIFGLIVRWVARTPVDLVKKR